MLVKWFESLHFILKVKVRFSTALFYSLNFKCRSHVGPMKIIQWKKEKTNSKEDTGSLENRSTFEIKRGGDIFCRGLSIVKRLRRREKMRREGEKQKRK